MDEYSRPAQEPPDAAGDEAAAHFVPLRLVLQPTGAAIDVNRPDMVAGRHSEADIRLPLPDVSRRHCRFVCVEGCWQVIDLNSLNGVYVNDEQVLQAPLQQGDRVRIGGFTFTVDLPVADESEPDAAESLIRHLFHALPAPHDGRQHRRAS
jgi:pSer/pThr/pTyr-binding forkhead associated (FHA) protein